MDDKCIMEDLLITTKGVCDLYHHGTVESATQNVHEAFRWAMNEALTMQNGIYSEMAAKGWYPPDPAPAQKVAKVREKYSQTTF